MPPITAQQIDAILPFLEHFQAPGFSAGSWNQPEGHFPFVNFHEVVMEFQQALNANGWIDQAFDWNSWHDSAMKYVNSPLKLEKASAATIRKLFTAHVRANRFCEGHLISMFEKGHIEALLIRLKAIRDEIG